MERLMEAQSYWQWSARRLIWRNAFARWLDLFLPAGLSLAVAAAVAQLILRELRMEILWLWPAFQWSLLAAALGSLAGLRGRMWSRAQALGWLDEHGHLHNRLTCAVEGVGLWPAPKRVPDPVRWRWRRLFYPLVLAAGVIAGSIFIPIPELAARETPHDQPLAWSQVQTWTDLLKESKLPEPAALEKLQQQLGELRQQSPDKWYSQSSLEAGDSLRRQTEQSLEGMQEELRRAAEVVENMGQQGANAPPEKIAQMREQLGQALQGLQMGNLPLNRELMKKLKDLNPGSMPNLSPEQMKQLRQRLQEGGEVCKHCIGPHEQGSGEGGPSEYPGQDGGKGGGGQTAPLTLKDDPTDLRSKETETLSSEDFSRALPADLAGISAGEHEVKKDAPARPVAGGEIHSVGEGGDQAWKSAVLPRERAVLQRFFK
jgi:hypothetical protein